ncbi:hypothetical protein BsWGS_08674 [Bradybaena similaris]
MAVVHQNQLTSAEIFCYGKPGLNLEVEVYVKVVFRVQTWDGFTKEHEADLPAHVTIGDLKEDLKNELGDPKFSEWVIVKSGVKMSDDKVIYNTYKLHHNDEINVFVYKSPATGKQSDHC